MNDDPKEQRMTEPRLTHKQTYGYLYLGLAFLLVELAVVAAVHWFDALLPIWKALMIGWSHW